MSEEKSKLVETTETVESTETVEDNTDGFDPVAFSTLDAMNEVVAKYDDEKAEQLDEANEENKESTESTENSEEQEDEDGFSWDSIETETKEEVEEAQEEEDWDAEFQTTEEVEETPEQEEVSNENQEVDWKKVGKELGLKEGISKEDIEAMLNTPFTPDVSTDTSKKLNEFLQLKDKDLLAEEMKADGMKEEEIEEVLDKMDDSGVLKREAYRIRRQLKAAIEAEKEAGLKKLAMEDKTKKEQAGSNRQELQGHLKAMENFMGGKVNKKDKQEAYKYIVSGNMAQDIWKSHGNASEVAMFMLYKDKFAKVLRNQGLEDGKASILNKITSPNLSGKSKPSYKIKDGNFDPAAFLRE